MKKSYLVIGGLLAIILARATCNKNLASKQRSGSLLNEAMKDSLEHERNNLGQQISNNKVLFTSNKKLLLDLHTLDSTVLWLKEVLKANPKTPTAVVSKVITNIDTFHLVDSVRFVDTVRIGNIVRLFPEYSTEWNEKWSSGSIVANKDTIFRQIQFSNSFEIWFEMERRKKSIFSKKVPVVYWKNNNPLTATDKLKSWKVEVPRQRFSIGIISGVMYGYNPLCNCFGMNIGAGIGIQYKLVEF